MRAFASPLLAPSLCLYFLAVSAALTGCGGREAHRDAAFPPTTPFSKRLQGSGDFVCWSVKRAFLTQGYMLDRSSNAILIGTKDEQPDDETNVTLHLQTTCMDNRDGTSTVFASASREVSKLQKVKSSLAAGVGPATFSWPSGSEKSLHVIKRETIQDANFYQGFYNLVQQFAWEEEASSRSRPPSRSAAQDSASDSDRR